MTFCIITHVAHGHQNGAYYAYSPYVREMNIWSKYVDDILLVAPLTLTQKTAIDMAYTHPKIDFKSVAPFHFLTLSSALKTIIALPGILYTIFKAMQRADHIHLRCPGNMGLLGCCIQVLFPKKPKTAKYAGNWDLKAKQPLSYRLQKWILSNTFLTKNMKVLVYGEWEKSTRNIKPFFTASYFEKDKTAIDPRDFSGEIGFLFVGTLSVGKQPLYAVKLIEALNQKGFSVTLTVFGEGAERSVLENYIREKKIEHMVFLKGNQSQETVRAAYLKNHFVVLPSLSEGWPKVVAEGMFWGCLPIATQVSCVPNMLDYGNRGMLLTLSLADDAERIANLLNDLPTYQAKVTQAMQWSRHYTMDLFETEIQQLLQ